MKTRVESDELVRAVVGLAMKVHRHFGPGFAEVVYQNSLVWELRRSATPVLCQHPLKVSYEGVIVGEFVADLLVADRLLVELKSARALDSAHDSQLVHYLHATGVDLGLLLNFGAPSLQFRTKTREFAPDHQASPDLAGQ